jgi:hypothetical protein
MTTTTRGTASRRDGRKAESERREVEKVEEPRDPPERDLFDSPSDSWRDLEHRQMLDEIESSPTERL